MIVHAFIYFIQIDHVLLLVKKIRTRNYILNIYIGLLKKTQVNKTKNHIPWENIIESANEISVPFAYIYAQNLIIQSWRICSYLVGVDV